MTFENSLNSLNYFSPLLTFLATGVLVWVTAYYAKTTYRMLAEEKKKNEQLEKQKLNTIKNYIYLINAEMLNHQYHYFLFLRYCDNINDERLKNLFKQILQHFNCNLWDSINIELSRCFPLEIVEELVAYYMGLKSFIRIIELHINNTNWLTTFFKRNKINYNELLNITQIQLSCMYKCIDMFEETYKIELQKSSPEYEIDGRKFTFNKDDGKINNVKTNIIK